MQTERVFVIGSIKQSSEIEYVAKAVEKLADTNCEVRYVRDESESEPHLGTLIRKAYRNILWSDRVVAVSKHDFSIGDGTAYEIAFAELFKKPVTIVTVNNYVIRGLY